MRRRQRVQWDVDDMAPPDLLLTPFDRQPTGEPAKLCSFGKILMTRVRRRTSGNFVLAAVRRPQPASGLGVGHRVEGEV